MLVEKSESPPIPLVVFTAFLVTAFNAKADSYAACGVQKDPQLYDEVNVVSIISKELRVLDPKTRKIIPKTPRVDKEDVVNAGQAVRDAYGLICLQKKKGGGHIWTYSSAVKYECFVKKAELPPAAAAAGLMGIGRGGCDESKN